MHKDQSDGGVLKNTDFGRKLKNGTLNIPKGQNLPYNTKSVPLYFVVDEAFPLQLNFMRPYSKLRR